MENLGPGRLLKIMGMFMHSKILLVAHKIGVFEAIGNEKKNLDEVSFGLKIDRRHCGILLNSLVAIGVLIKDNDALYCNCNDVKEFLLKDSANYFGSLLLFQENEWDSWNFLFESLMYQRPMGIEINEAMSLDELEIYIQAMHETGKFPSSIIPSLIDLKNCKSLLDLGCGSGIYSMGFLRRNPHLEINLLDYPDVIKLTRKYIPNEFRYSNINYIEANYLNYEFDRKYDCVFCSHNLHEHSDEINQSLAEKMYDSINNGGMVVLHDYITDNNEIEPLFPVVFSVNMIIQTRGGKCYSYTEISQWLQKAGFINVRLVKLGIDFPSSIIIASKR